MNVRLSVCLSVCLLIYISTGSERRFRRDFLQRISSVSTAHSSFRLRPNDFMNKLMRIMQVCSRERLLSTIHIHTILRHMETFQCFSMIHQAAATPSSGRPRSVHSHLTSRPFCLPEERETFFARPCPRGVRSWKANSRKVRSTVTGNS